MTGGDQAMVQYASLTALLVEDDQDVRVVLRDMLKRLGFQVIEARNGRHALDPLIEHPSEIHLLLTDIVMPIMTGVQLADIARSLRPGIKVLYVSGHTEDPEVRDRISLQPDFIEKPVSLNKLRQTLSDMMLLRSPSRQTPGRAHSE